MSYNEVAAYMLSFQRCHLLTTAGVLGLHLVHKQLPEGPVGCFKLQWVEKAE